MVESDFTHNFFSESEQLIIIWVACLKDAIIEKIVFIDLTVDCAVGALFTSTVSGHLQYQSIITNMCSLFKCGPWKSISTYCHGPFDKVDLPDIVGISWVSFQSFDQYLENSKIRLGFTDTLEYLRCGLLLMILLSVMLSLLKIKKACISRSFNTVICLLTFSTRNFSVSFFISCSIMSELFLIICTALVVILENIFLSTFLVWPILVAWEWYLNDWSSKFVFPMHRQLPSHNTEHKSFVICNYWNPLIPIGTFREANKR